MAGETDGQKNSTGGATGQILDNREQANDGLWAAHAELPSLPGESLVSALPPCCTASVMRHPAEGGGLCQLRIATQPANIQIEGEPSHKHIFSPSLPPLLIHIHTRISACVCLATCSDSDNVLPGTPKVMGCMHADKKLGHKFISSVQP